MSEQNLLASFKEASELLKHFSSKSENIQTMEKIITCMSESLKNGGKILSCGNGGSMCDAMHFAEELSGRFKKDRPALGALAISDPAHISCVANDYGYDVIFSRQVEALGRPGDILLGISTSGNSRNVINAVEAAKSRGMKTIALLGKNGGQLKEMVDLSLVIESGSTARVQEIHIKIIHMLIENIEQKIFPELI